MFFSSFSCFANNWRFIYLINTVDKVTAVKKEFVDFDSR